MNSREQLKIKCEQVAAKLMFFNGISISYFDMFIEEKGLMFRKNKDFTSVRHAFDKAKKLGKQKVELELEWFALYLCDVLKPSNKI